MKTSYSQLLAEVVEVEQGSFLSLFQGRRDDSCFDSSDSFLFLLLFNNEEDEVPISLL